MFTLHNKIKEQIIFFAKSANISFLTYENKDFQNFKKQKDFENLIVMTYQYNTNGIEIKYNKWFMEGFEFAQQMNLPGCEHHDQLVKGSGVRILSKKHGTVFFYGKDAKDIIDTYEENCDIQSLLLENQTKKQK